jgi:hypothetical protein
VSASVAGNVGGEPEPKAMIQRFDADGSNQTTVTSDTSDPTALALQPGTGELWPWYRSATGSATPSLSDI